MKYCLNYYKLSKVTNEVDELIFSYDKTVPDLFDQLKSKLETFNDKNIYLKIKIEEINTDIINKIAEIGKEFNNFELLLEPNYLNSFRSNEIDIIHDIAENKNIKFFFMTRATNYEILNLLLDCGATQVYVCEQLGFELKTVAPMIHELGKKVRVFPNIAQTSCPYTYSYYSFFIRPEDVDKYEPYVDVLDFFYDKNADKKYIGDTLFKIYKTDKKWNGKLNELILDWYGTDIVTELIPTSFATRRINCGRRCLKNKSSCNLCGRIANYSDVFMEEYNKRYTEREKEVPDWKEFSEYLFSPIDFSKNL